MDQPSFSHLFRFPTGFFAGSGYLLPQIVLRHEQMFQHGFSSALHIVVFDGIKNCGVMTNHDFDPGMGNRS